MHVRLWAAHSQLGLFFACMPLLSWLAGEPLPVAVAVFDIGKRGHRKKPIAVLIMASVISAYLFVFANVWCI